MVKNCRFQILYEALGLSWTQVYRETNNLLQLYRDAVWTAGAGAQEVRLEASSCAGLRLGEALFFLADFAPEPGRECFERRVTGLFEAQRMIGVVDAAMQRVRQYHEHGPTYHQILSLAYLSERKLPEAELLDALHMSRTNYYGWRREAVSLLGLALHTRAS
ncbi:MAG: DUF1492 domain-containing protein [Oscillospiraceae bacterium]|jgi:hypothetical protein|nr:DUF1492 domain-containing protein [Oscillospiraceae bacterium]